MHASLHADSALACAVACRPAAPFAAGLLDLALWRQPQQSGAVLGVATLVFFVFEKLRYSALALVSQALLVAVLGSALWHAFAKFTNKVRDCLSRALCARQHAAPPHR